MKYCWRCTHCGFATETDQRATPPDHDCLSAPKSHKVIRDYQAERVGVDKAFFRRFEN